MGDFRKNVLQTDFERKKHANPLHVHINILETCYKRSISTYNAKITLSKY